MQMEAQPLTNETGYDCYDEVYGYYVSPIPCDFVAACRERCTICQTYYDCDEIPLHMTMCSSSKTSNDNNNNDLIQSIEEISQGGGGGSDGGGAGSGHGGGGGSSQYLPNIIVNGNYSPSLVGIDFLWPDPTPVVNKEDTILRSPNTTPLDSTSEGYHRCPCMITVNAKYYLNQIDNDPKWDELNNLYEGLTDGLKRHLAFPETIQQGNNGTCAAALIQKYLAENHPDKYEECVYELAKNGKYEPWGLEIPAACNLTGISDYELRNETGDVSKYNQGIDFTADDALMQTAIQNWSDNNNWFRRVHNKITGNAYSVINDDGDLGGMTVDDRSSFLFNVSPLSMVNNLGKTSYYELAQKLKTYSPDEYTIMAGVDMQYNDKGYYFGNKHSNHALEISGIENGYIKFWSYGKEDSTIKQYGGIGSLVIIKKTDYAKEEKQERKSLTCNCPDCTNDGCSKCM